MSILNKISFSQSIILELNLPKLIYAHSLFMPNHDELQQETTVKPSEPVMCLGQTFVSDEERRKHFTALLREKLKVFRLEAVRAGFMLMPLNLKKSGS
ncbi:MAG: hypothetical protein D0528_04465 [Methylococcales bacterium]|nr:MAG: hypothetical protein D0528_04465 [Methylococcales bacterium]